MGGAIDGPGPGDIFAANGSSGKGMTEDPNLGLGALPSLLVERPGATDSARADILKAAAAAFNERGYDATSIDDIADMLGATKGRIYHYYRSKADIFLDLHLESLRILIGQVGAIANHKDLSPTERIRRMAYEHARDVMNRINYRKATMLGLSRVLLSISSPYQDAARKRVNELRDEYENLFVATIAEGVETGEFRPIDPRFATKPLLGALNYLANWYEGDTEGALGTIDEIATALSDYCVRGLAAR
jgi:AcrR family transcriptional regulator